MADKRTKEQEAEQGGLSFGALTPYECRGCTWAHIPPGLTDADSKWVKYIKNYPYMASPYAWRWDKSCCQWYPYGKPNQIMMPEKYDWSEYDNIVFCGWFIEETDEEKAERLAQERYSIGGIEWMDKGENECRKRLKEKYGLILPTLEERIERSEMDDSEEPLGYMQ